MHPRANRRGYTFVEMVVLVTILSLVSIFVMPSLVSMKKSSDTRETMAGLRRIAADARERAIQNDKPTEIIYDESKKQLQILDVNTDGTQTTDGTTEAVRSVDLLAGIEPERFEIDGKDSNTTDFKITFSPDGRCTGGGIEFKDFSILVDSDGHSQYIEGALPDPTDEVWQAGNLEQRTQG
ncbi:MAG TPA: type II secretion system protein [Fimbriimonadaceae bacterium]|nr:type II secretion system protein [Fimbriimonadaceae bacterium]